LRHLTDYNIDNFTANKIREALTTLSAPIDSDAVVKWMINFIKIEIPKRKANFIDVQQQPL